MGHLVMAARAATSTLCNSAESSKLPFIHGIFTTSERPEIRHDSFYVAANVIGVRIICVGNRCRQLVVPLVNLTILASRMCFCLDYSTYYRPQLRTSCQKSNARIAATDFWEMRVRLKTNLNDSDPNTTQTHR